MTEQTEQQGVDFTKFHLHISMPCYGGMVSEATMTSMFKFILVAKAIGLEWSFDTISNESLVTRARNNLCAKMMANPDATHFMFIDADIRFEPMAIVGMLVADKDVIGGIYPKKGLPIDYNLNLAEETQIQGQLFTVETLGNGFLMFKRHVYERMIKSYPETKYIDDVNYGKEFEPHMYAIFDTYIDHTGRYLSEDWAFCKRWKKLGGEIWAHGGVLLNHLGHFEFTGDLSKMPAFAQPQGDVSGYAGNQDVPPALLDTLKMKLPKKENENE
jgi:hypothetical protein